MDSDVRVRRLRVYQSEARGCARCHAHDLLHVDERRGIARPMLQQNPTGALAILIVGEAPNWSDTYKNGRLTYDAETDPTGRFMRQLLIEEAGLLDREIDDVLFTNAALCLPARHADKHPVRKPQMDLCRPWITRLLEDAEVKIVITMGAVPLRALNHIERHRLTLRTGAGRLHDWFGRRLLPLYHAGSLGRMSRKEAEQRSDMRALREFLGR